MRIGIDLGGTKTEGIALDDGGTVLLRHRQPTRTGDYRQTLTDIALLVERIEQETGRRGTVGIGIPGTVSRTTGNVKNANSTWLIGQPFARDISRLLAREIRVANDADCFSLSEATDGAAAGYSTVFGVILGTGVGGGAVIGGQLLEGVNGIACEWGHNPLPRPGPAELPGPVCYCGRQGCIETFLSGPGMAADHERTTGNRLTAIEIAYAAAAGDVGANATLERFEDRLARALATVINILDPAAIVLGGGLSNIDRLYRTVPPLLPRHVFSDDVETVLLAPRHGDASGVRGAAWLWPAGAPSD